MIKPVKKCVLIFAAVVAFHGIAPAVEPVVESPAAHASAAAAPLQVVVVGKGRPMILIPGLACSGAVWRDTVEHYKTQYECHVVTLAGFAGVPPVEGAFLPTMRDALLRYIEEKKLQRPVIVGHSLGGHLALAMAIRSPQAVGPIVVVDGGTATGVLMSPPGTAAAAIAQQANAMGVAMAGMGQEQFAAQNRAMLGTMVHDPKIADGIAQAAGKSDVKAVARAMSEVMTADLRDASAKIASPVLLIGAAEYAKGDAMMAAVRARYEQQVAKIPRHKVVMTSGARHFVMLDQPNFFYAELDRFVAESGR